MIEHEPMHQNHGPARSLRERPDDVQQGDRDHERRLGRGEEDEDGGERVVCAACGHRITDTRQRASLGGHWHRRTNPAGVTFDLALYHRAPGCRQVGDPTTEHTWFAGFAWSFALCGECGAHLGWCFQGKEGEGFWGLITDRVRVLPED